MPLPFLIAGLGALGGCAASVATAVSAAAVAAAPTVAAAGVATAGAVGVKKKIEKEKEISYSRGVTKGSEGKESMRQAFEKTVSEKDEVIKTKDDIIATKDEYISDQDDFINNKLNYKTRLNDLLGLYEDGVISAEEYMRRRYEIISEI